MVTLFIFSGLPGTGKSTLSQQLAQQAKAVYLRIDTIEQALRDLCDFQVEGEGYRLAYRIATDNLRLGIDVVADSCNPLALTRCEWEEVALATQASCFNIEVVCSDTCEHRQRVETRISNISGLILPTWGEVESREYHAWSKDRIIIDTAGKSKIECFDALRLALGFPDKIPN
jgi:predicted kinase